VGVPVWSWLGVSRPSRLIEIAGTAGDDRSAAAISPLLLLDRAQFPQFYSFSQDISSGHQDFTHRLRKN
jgi:hypothetical protein